MRFQVSTAALILALLACQKAPPPAPPRIEGTKLPEFSGTDQAGNRITASEYAGRVLILEIVDSPDASPPAAQRLASLEKFLGGLDPANVAVLIVSSGSQTEIEAWTKARALTARHLVDGGALRTKLGLGSHSATLVFDRRGVAQDAVFASEADKPGFDAIFQRAQALAAAGGEPKPQAQAQPQKPEVPRTADGAVDWSAAFRHSVGYDPPSGSLVVDVEIGPGFHAYTVGETIGRPLQLDLDAGSAFELAGPVEYPKGTAKDLPVGKSVIVEGKAKVTAPLKPKTQGAAGKASGTFRYQVCTDDACDRPRSAPFALQVPASQG